MELISQPTLLSGDFLKGFSSTGMIHSKTAKVLNDNFSISLCCVFSAHRKILQGTSQKSAIFNQAIKNPEK